nr:unnamed protein product [Callosobruchus analis]
MKGTGLLATVIDKLSVELHIPGFRFCGPDTKLNQRLAKGDTGVNPLGNYFNNTYFCNSILKIKPRHVIY